MTAKKIENIIIIQEEIEIIAMEEKNQRKILRRTLRRSPRGNLKRKPRKTLKKIRRSMTEDQAQAVHLALPFLESSLLLLVVSIQVRLSLVKFSDPFYSLTAEYLLTR